MAQDAATDRRTVDFEVPSTPEADLPVDARLEEHYEEHRRRQRGPRLVAALYWSSVLWVLFPCIECLTVGAPAPLAAGLHLSIVVPIGLIVARMVYRDPTGPLADSAAVAMALTAVSVTLVAHRLDPVFDGETASLDFFALVPIVHLAVVMRPQRRPLLIGTAVAVLLTAAAFVDTLGLVGAVPSIGAVLAVAAVAIVAGQYVDLELRYAHLARLRSDLTVRRLTHRNDELRQLSELDTLTGLPNRRSVDLRLLEVAEWSRVETIPIAVMMIDVDHFKQFNDRFGHPAGDRCLAAVAGAVKEQIRRLDDFIGRFGGEEFIAILPGADVVVATRVAERIRAAVEALAIPQVGHKGETVVTISVGCASASVQEIGSVDELLKAADAQLYVAKRRGRNRVAPPPPPPADDGAGRAGPTRAAA